MNNPLHFFHTGPSPTISGTQVRADSRVAETAGYPTPQSVGFEIGVILVVTLGIACAVPLVLSVCGIK
jgi:hypothetical protein